MLKGHVFNLQTFTSECFALFIDTFLNKNNGIVKGCILSSSGNTATVGEGFYVVKGRFLEIISSETVTVSDDGYYSLIHETDLSKTNTTTQLNQATIKVVKGSTTYPALSQTDSLYQYEFAKFKVENGVITDFTDTRTFINIQSIYNQIENKTDGLIEQIQQALAGVLDGSAYLLKVDVEPNSLINKGELVASTDIRNLEESGIYICNSPTTAKGYPTTLSGVLEVIKSSETSGHVIQRYSVDGSNVTYERHIGEEVGSWVKIINSGDFAVLTGTITMPEAGSENITGSSTVNYPSGFTKDNCVVVSIMSHNTVHTDWWATPQSPTSSSLLLGNGDTKAIFKPTAITIMSSKAHTDAARSNVTYKLVLMKIS